MVEDWHLVLVVSRGERRDLGQQAIAQRTCDLGASLDVGAVEDAHELLGNVPGNDGGALGVANGSDLSSIGLERLQRRLELPGDWMFVDPDGKQAHHPGSIARRGVPLARREEKVTSPCVVVGSARGARPGTGRDADDRGAYKDIR